MFLVNQAEVYFLGQPGGILYMFQVNQAVLDVLVSQAVDNVSGQPGKGLCFRSTRQQLCL